MIKWRTFHWLIVVKTAVFRLNDVFLELVNISPRFALKKETLKKKVKAK